MDKAVPILSLFRDRVSKVGKYDLVELVGLVAFCE